MDLQLLTEKIEQTTAAFNVKVDSILWQKLGHKKVLEINVYCTDGLLDLDLMTKITDPINQIIDQQTNFDFEYLVDIGSVGAQREILWEELQQAISKYIHVYLLQSMDGLHEFEGTLLGYDQVALSLKVNQKGRMKTIVIPKINLKRMNYEVKV